MIIDICCRFCPGVFFFPADVNERLSILFYAVLFSGAGLILPVLHFLHRDGSLPLIRHPLFRICADVVQCGWIGFAPRTIGADQPLQAFDIFR